mmetsp:Transcript_110803/g.203127  ORF Transcript_110803/g.203127 Transcript_110803/m.203127 type:complete len:637 (-) Transcript_110803:57-1967(-)
MRWLLRKPERDGSVAKDAIGMPTLAPETSKPAECAEWQSILVHTDQPESESGGHDRVDAASAGSGCVVADHPVLSEMPGGKGKMSGRRQAASLTGVLPPQRASAARERRAAVGFVKSAASAALRGLVCGSKQPRSPAESPEHSDRSEAQESSQDTWAQQRQEVSRETAGERFGCFGGGAASWASQHVFPRRRSASASREVAHRLRQRRHGCSVDKSNSAPGRSGRTTPGTPHRSQSCSPASSMLRHGAGAAPKTLSSPGAASWDSASSNGGTSPGLRSLQEKSISSPEAALPSEVLPLSLLDVDALDIVTCGGGSGLRSCSAPPMLGLLAGPAAADVPSPARLSPAGVTRAGQEAQTWNWQASSNTPSTLPSLPWPIPRDEYTTLPAGNTTNMEQINSSEMSPGGNCVDEKVPLLEPRAICEDATMTFTCSSPVQLPAKTDVSAIAFPAGVQPTVLGTGRRATWGAGESAILHMSANRSSGFRPSLRETRLHEAQQLLERMLMGGQEGGPGAAFGASPCHGMTMRNAVHHNFKAYGPSTLRSDSGPGRSLGRHASAPPAGGRKNLCSDASSGGGALCSVAPPVLGRVGARSGPMPSKAAPLQPLNGCMPWFPAAALQDPSLPRSQDGALPRVSAVA